MSNALKLSVGVCLWVAAALLLTIACDDSASSEPECIPCTHEHRGHPQWMKFKPGKHGKHEGHWRTREECREYGR